MRINLSLLIVTAVTMLTAACSNKPQDNLTMKKQGPSTDEMKLVGDKTVYGLACDGCSDSVVVLLPNDGSDPVTYDIIDAKRQGRILGKIKIGDWIGVTLNKADKKVADQVIDLDELKGIWCYIVYPKLKDYDKMSKRLQARMMRNMPDSVKETYLVPREYGFWMKRQWQCQSVGYVQEQSSLEEESPVIYPQLGYFTAWHIWNGYLVISGGTPHISKDNKQITITEAYNDTCSIDYLGNDSLVLSDRDGSRSYYRKDNINDVNKRAIAIAAQQQKKALKETTDNSK